MNSYFLLEDAFGAFVHIINNSICYDTPPQVPVSKMGMEGATEVGATRGSQSLTKTDTLGAPTIPIHLIRIGSEIETSGVPPESGALPDPGVCPHVHPGGNCPHETSQLLGGSALPDQGVCPHVHPGGNSCHGLGIAESCVWGEGGS